MKSLHRSAILDLATFRGPLSNAQRQHAIDSVASYYVSTHPETDISGAKRELSDIIQTKETYERYIDRINAEQMEAAQHGEQVELPRLHNEVEMLAGIFQYNVVLAEPTRLIDDDVANVDGVIGQTDIALLCAEYIWRYGADFLGRLHYFKALVEMWWTAFRAESVTMYECMLLALYVTMNVRDLTPPTQNLGGGAELKRVFERAWDNGVKYYIDVDKLALLTEAHPVNKPFRDWWLNTPPDQLPPVLENAVPGRRMDKIDSSFMPRYTSIGISAMLKRLVPVERHALVDAIPDHLRNTRHDRDDAYIRP